MKRKVGKNIARAVAAAVFVAVLILLLKLFDGGVTNREVRESVVGEAASLRDLVNARADAIDAKIDRLAADEAALHEKLSLIDAKLDALIKLATPSLPDGMRESR